MEYLDQKQLTDVFRAAYKALYSLIGTAKLNGIDPESYLRDVLSRIVDHPVNRIEALLPWHVAASMLPATPEAPEGKRRRQSLQPALRQRDHRTGWN